MRRRHVLGLAAATATSPLIAGLAAAPAAAADPVLGPNTYVFDPSMPAASIQSQLDGIFAGQESNQFGPQRYAIFFKPGTYNVNANIGFHTSIAGLGRNPDDVTLNGVTVDAGWFGGNATQNFWRSVENLAIAPPPGFNRWAVSQAAPMRRVHVRGDLNLAPTGYGWASGGYIADSAIDNVVQPYSQQQWLTRDSRIGGWLNGVWNMVFSGVAGAPGASFPNPPYTVLPTSPVTREKPYLYLDGGGQYQVFLPALRRNSSGTTWSGGSTPGTSLPLTAFHVATPGVSAATLNAALAAGKHLLFTPGIYHLNQTLNITRAGTVVLGLGYASLIPDNGITAMTVSDVDGVRLAGLLFDAGTVRSPVLLQVGQTGSGASHANDPTTVQDVYFRIGGPGPGAATTSLVVNSRDVIIDHIWAWRADHGAGVGWTTNPADTGVIVNGADVTAYGLFVEHYQKYQVIWNGQGGRTVFFQNEMPYDPPNQAAWRTGALGYAAYKVADGVTSHQAWGVGSYCYFNVDPSIVADRGFEVPNTAGVALRNLLTVSLGGNGVINHVINDAGGTASGTDTIPAYLAAYGGGSAPGPQKLDRAGWTATASSTAGGDVPGNMLDATGSRWSSGTPMVNGQWIVVDTKSAHNLRQITMDSGGYAGDYARGYQVYLSSDGVNWGSPVATGTGTGALVTVGFPARSARYVRVVQTGAASSWWSIVDFNGFV